MQTLLTHLSNPKVQELLAEWYALRTSGEVAVPAVPSPAADDIKDGMHRLFGAIRGFAQDHEVRLTLAELNHLGSPGGGMLATTCLPLLDQAESTCCDVAFPDAVVALALLRRKLGAAGLHVRDEGAVLAHVDEVVSLMVPGFSLLDLLQEVDTGGDLSAFWVPLTGLMASLDRHCPEAGGMMTTTVTTTPPAPSPSVGKTAPPSPPPRVVLPPL